MKNRYHEKCDFKLINKFHFPKPPDDQKKANRLTKPNHTSKHMK